MEKLYLSLNTEKEWIGLKLQIHHLELQDSYFQFGDTSKVN